MRKVRRVQNIAKIRVANLRPGADEWPQRQNCYNRPWLTWRRRYPTGAWPSTGSAWLKSGRAAVVVEDDYQDLFRTQPGRGSWLADMLGRLAVRL